MVPSADYRMNLTQHRTANSSVCKTMVSVCVCVCGCAWHVSDKTSDLFWQTHIYPIYICDTRNWHSGWLKYSLDAWLHVCLIHSFEVQVKWIIHYMVESLSACFVNRNGDTMWLHHINMRCIKRTLKVSLRSVQPLAEYGNLKNCMHSVGNCINFKTLISLLMRGTGKWS